MALQMDAVEMIALKGLIFREQCGQGDIASRLYSLLLNKSRNHNVSDCED